MSIAGWLHLLAFNLGSLWHVARATFMRPSLSHSSSHPLPSRGANSAHSLLTCPALSFGRANHSTRGLSTLSKPSKQRAAMRPAAAPNSPVLRPVGRLSFAPVGQAAGRPVEESGALPSRRTSPLGEPAFEHLQIFYGRRASDGCFPRSVPRAPERRPVKLLPKMLC